MYSCIYYVLIHNKYAQRHIQNFHEAIGTFAPLRLSQPLFGTIRLKAIAGFIENPPGFRHRTA